MGVDVSTSITIACPRDRVSEFSGHPSNAPEWYVNIKSIDWVTDPEPEIGSRMAFVAQFLGRRLAYTYEITELEPGHRMVMRTAEGPFPMETTYTWEDAPDGGTNMTLRNRGQPAGFSRVMAPLMVAAMKRANRKDLHLLKEIMETRCAE